MGEIKNSLISSSQSIFRT